MGRRGPAPHPTSLRLLRGEKPYRLNTTEPRPRDIAPERPDLSRWAARVWDQIEPDLVAMDCVRAVDARAVAHYCEATAMASQLERVLAEEGPMLTDVDGVMRQHPAFSLWKQASAEARMWGREIGMSPAARQPLHVQHADHGLPAERLLT